MCVIEQDQFQAIETYSPEGNIIQANRFNLLCNGIKSLTKAQIFLALGGRTTIKYTPCSLKLRKIILSRLIKN
ncbi:hypothetical protein GCM10010913_08120 [Paenibacillus aceti]|uniref:Uncharacterized protein n=1 Tax=Paenibacillus aceti TaxID=1820010 RepID=A0ABQ1VRN4_9BACL|nr:hypothetical protein GCM10010913_08120 [Paenibacillus aceti]